MTRKFNHIRHQRASIKRYIKNKIILSKIINEIISGKIYSKGSAEKRLDEINLPETVKFAGVEGAICYLKQFDI